MDNIIVRISCILTTKDDEFFFGWTIKL